MTESYTGGNIDSRNTSAVPSYSWKDDLWGYPQVSIAAKQHQDAALAALNNYKPTNAGWVGNRNPWDNKLS